MKEQLWFVIKTLITTLLMVMVLQTRVGQSTMEQHLLGFYYSSSLVVPVQEAVDGGVRAIRVGWKSVVHLISLKDKTGKSRWPINFERHPKALEKSSTELEQSEEHSN